MNPFSLMRFGNLFGQQEQEDPMGDNINMGLQTRVPSINQSIPVQDDGIEEFQPEHKYSDEFDSMLQNMPTRGKPGFWRKLGATFASAGLGPERAEHALYAPYYRDLEDWTNKIRPIQAGMTDERARNTQNRQFSQSLNTLRVNQQNADTRERAAAAKAANDTDKTKIARDRADVYKYKAEHPNHQFKSDEAGYMYSIDPQTNKVEYLRNAEGDPIKSDKLPEQVKLDIQLNHDLQKIDARGNVQRGLTELRGTIEDRHIANRGEEARTTKKTVPGKAPGSTSDKPLTPSAQATAIINRANEWKAHNPDLAKYVTIKGRNVEIAKPAGTGIMSKFGGGMPDDKRAEAEAYIYGASQQPMNTHTDNTSTKVRVMSPDGRKGTIDKSELAEAIKNGWKEVKQ